MKTVIFILMIVGTIITSCTPKNSYYDKMTELATSDLRQKVKVPSSFIIDSTKIKIVENHIQLVHWRWLIIHFSSLHIFSYFCNH